jgi:taspase (threonine aspartase 1)
LPSSVPQEDLNEAKSMQDTVGAISWDSNGKLAAGVSRFATGLECSRADLVHSGGLLLKYPGRIGEVRKLHVCSGSSANTQKATVFGAGCWSQSDSRIGVTCSVSGLVHHPAFPMPRVNGL